MHLSTSFALASRLALALSYFIQHCELASWTSIGFEGSGSVAPALAGCAGAPVATGPCCPGVVAQAASSSATAAAVANLKGGIGFFPAPRRSVAQLWPLRQHWNPKLPSLVIGSSKATTALMQETGD